MDSVGMWNGMGMFGTQYVAMVTKLLSLYCRVHLIESYCQESNISESGWKDNVITNLHIIET